MDDNAVEAEMWEIAENLHRLDLTKEQRDEHIRRYADLLETKAKVSTISGQVVQKLVQVGRPKETAAIIAEETGLSQRTVRRALNPKPREIVSVREAETDEEPEITSG